MNILAALKNIKAFVLDVDGVLTDGSLVLLNDGQMARTMNIKDGYALQLAVKKEYKILAISGGVSDAVVKRLQKLGITDIYMDVKDKTVVLSSFIAAHGFTKEQVLYMGDDVPDITAMKLAGIACCPSDAATQIKSISHYIAHLPGGKGCVREVIEKVLLLHGNWNDDTHIASV